MRLQTKLLLLLIPLIVVPLLALGWIAYSMLMDDARDRTQDQMTTLLQQINIQTRTLKHTARANASLFASTNLVQRILQDDGASAGSEALRNKLNALLFTYQVAYPEYYEIRLLSPDGIELNRSALGKLDNRTTDESGNPHFIASSSHTDTIYTAFLRNPDNSEPALLVSKPLFFPVADTKSGATSLELHGYLQLTVDPRFLKAHTAKGKIGENGRIFFTDPDGNILFREPGSGDPEQVPAKLLGALKDGIANQRPVAGKFNGQAVSFRGTKLDDWLYMHAYYPEAELLAQRNRMGTTVTLITCITILVTMALLFGVLNSLLIRPVKKLSHAATEIGRGQVQAPIDITSRDEIGDLARSFRIMGENLSHYHERVHHVAYHDNLTQLPNRMMFREHLFRVTAEARRSERSPALLFLDLDNFKRINDTLGHHAGDKLLAAFAERLAGCLRESDLVGHASDGNTSSDNAGKFVARLAGDEFIVLLPHVNDASDAGKIAKRILGSMSDKFVIGTHEVFITTSIGITVFPDDGDTATDLMKNADIAMYSAKKLGRNNFQYYSRKLNEAAVHKLEIEGRLRGAVENGELELYYQPQLDLATGRICGAESLLRWRNPELGTVSPEVFIPIAEQYGLIVPISEWIMQQACQQCRRWQTMYPDPITMSINVSAVHFNGRELESLVARSLKQTGLEPQSIELELTESGILHDPDLAISTMKAFRKMGVSISLDDFGTGYSSLSYLMTLPIDKLKIDRSFIMNLERDKRGAPIISAIISMAHSLGLSVIAEGVEKESELNLLKTMHCDIIQGYYIARPLPVENFEELMATPALRQA